MYKILFEKEASQEFLKLPKNVQKIIKEKLDILAKDPRLLENNIKSLKGELKGLKRLRVGKYRIIYQQKDNELIILIIRIASRGEIY